MTTKRTVELFWKLTRVVFEDGAGCDSDEYARILKGIGCTKEEITELLECEGVEI